MRWLEGITVSMAMNLGKFWEVVSDWQASVLVHGVTKSQTGDLATAQQQTQTHSCPKSEAKSKQALRFKHYFTVERKQSEVTQLCLTLQPCGLQPTRLLHPWDFPGKSTGVSYHFLLQGIFLTQGSNPGLSHCRQTFYHLGHHGIYSKRQRNLQ